MSIALKTALVAIAAVQLESLVAFYRQLLGQDPMIYRPQVYAEFHLPDLRLGLFQPRQACLRSHPPAPTGLSLCLEVSDLEAAIAHLTALGYPPDDVITASHGREVYAYDPEGNWLILHQSW